MKWWRAIRKLGEGGRSLIPIILSNIWVFETCEMFRY
jgi:hypothetical protein